MKDHRPPESEREARLDGIVAEYLQAADAGEAPEPSAFVARYPEFTRDLNDFFEDRESFERVAAPFSPRGTDQTYSDSTPAGGSETWRFGEYELLEQVGRGGMGVVYKARHVRLNRTVALKMILAGHFARQEDVRRFEIEAENAARLDHPNIVPIYEAGRFQGRSFFTMKLVAGGSLTHQIPRLVKDPRAAAGLIAKAARALHYAHQRGILHRDLKSGNILLDDEGQPQIADFGLARMIECDGEFTLSGAILGTPSYMAPEQASSVKSLTTAVDVYGLGAILYELLTGSPPFRGDTALQTLRMVREQAPRRPSAFDKSVNLELETICLKSLSKQPDDRYGSAEALAEDLERWLEGRPIHARPTGRLNRSIKWVVRRPALGALIATSVVAILGLIVAAIAWPYSLRLREALGQKQIALDEKQIALGEKQIALTDAGRAREAEKRQRVVAEEALAQSETLTYLNQISWAEREWSTNNLGRAEQLLDQCPPALRRWEWYHLKALCHSEIVSVAQDENVVAVVPRPNGESFLTLTDDGVLQAWNVSGAPLPIIGSESTKFTSVAAVALSADGSRCAVAFTNGIIQVWDRMGDGPATPTRRLTDEPSSCLALSRDGRWLASGNADKAVKVWDLNDDSPPRSLGGHSRRINAVAFSPDGRILASCSGEPARMLDNGKLIPESPGEIKTWETAGGSNESTFGAGTGVISSIVFTTENRLAAAHSDTTIKLWNLTTGLPERTFWGHSGPVLSVAANRDGSRLASAGADHTVRVWDTHTGQPLWSGGEHKAAVYSVAFLPDDQRLVTGGADNATKVWQTRSSPDAQIFRQVGQFSDVAFSPDGTGLAVATNSGFFVLDRIDGHPMFQAQAERRTRLAFSPDGSLVAVGRRVFDLRAGRGVAVAPLGHRQAYGIAFSPDGRELASGSGSPVMQGDQNGVMIWDWRSGKQVKYLTEDGLRGVFAVAFSPDGRLVASGGGKWSGGFGEIKLWDRGTGHVVHTMNGDPFCVWSLAFSKDGSRMVSGGGLEQGNPPGMVRLTRPGEPCGRVQLWDVATGRELWRWPSPECVFCVAFSPDGSRVASAGGFQGSRDPSDVTLLDTVHGRQVYKLHGHQGAIYGLAFSPDGRSLASASVDGTVRTWSTMNTER